MTKADLIAEVSRVVETTRKEAEVIVETMLASVVDGLRDGESCIQEIERFPYEGD